MKTVLSTKKLSEKQKNKLENAGFLIVEKNFISTKNIVFQFEETHQNLIFTSKKAVKSILHIKEQLVANKVFCVGERTKKYLEKNGFHVVEYKNYAEDLAHKIITDFPTESFTFFCGNLRRNTLPEMLLANKITFNEIQVYTTQLKSHKITDKIDVILFFSPSGITSYLEKNTITNQKCICIGKTTANALQNKTQNVLISSKPTIKRVVETCIKTIN